MSKPEKITVDLSPEMAGALRRAVESGAYATAGDAVGAALREWRERREPIGYDPAELAALVVESIASGPSPYATMDEVKAEARRRLVREGR